MEIYQVLSDLHEQYARHWTVGHFIERFRVWLWQEYHLDDMFCIEDDKMLKYLKIYEKHLELEVI